MSERSFQEIYPPFEIEFRNNAEEGHHAIVRFRYKNIVPTNVEVYSNHSFNFSGTIFVKQLENLRISPDTLPVERPDILNNISENMIEYGNNSDLSFEQTMLLSKGVHDLEHILKANRKKR